MSFEQENGYTPRTFDEFMEALRLGVNAKNSTSYTAETFVGTNWYKFFYPLVQEALKNETKAAEIFQRLQEYFQQTNEKILRPTVSYPGLFDAFGSQGFVISIRPPATSYAGILGVCVDTDESAGSFASVRLQICNLLKDYTAAGMVFDGSHVETLTLTNGQNFPFGFFTPSRVPILLRVTAIESENNKLPVPDDISLRQQVADLIKERYRLGFNFEPQRYANVDEMPWAGSVVLEWSTDGSIWHDEIADLNFNALYTFNLEDIAVTITPA